MTHLPTPELLAPVGSFESLQAAIQARADAVYFGVGQLNMRSASAKNFAAEDLPEIAAQCHAHQIRSYLAVNTIIYEEEIPAMQALITQAREVGVDAIIASDVAAMQYANRIGMEVHISTQANISNSAALRFYAGFADVMVLARELTLDQIQQINNAIRDEDIRGPSGQLVRTEAFIHGALCMAISGRCYLSAQTQNRSANRGACLQLCRRSYQLQDVETGQRLEIDNRYILSPKDLCTIDFLDKILAAGVTILKIEGRARPAEYVKTTVKCYRETLQAIKEDTCTDAKIADWKKRLQKVFNRGFWEGYYLGAALPELSRRYGSQATERKIFIGRGINYFQKVGVSEFVIQTQSLHKGDKILISGPTTGIIEHTIDTMMVDDAWVDHAVQGQHVTFPLKQKIRNSDQLFKLVPASSK